MDNFYARYPVTGGTVTNRYGIWMPPDDVGTKLNWFAGNSLFGGSTFTAPTTAIDTPTIRVSTSPTAGYVLTSDATGVGTWQVASGGGANVFLSNLSSPTAINQTLNFGTTVNGQLQTNDESTLDTTQLIVKTGDAATGHNSGALALETGSGDATSDISVFTGAAAAGSSGNINMQSGTAAGGNSGALVFASGSSDNSSGDVNLLSGSSTSTTGNLFLASGGSTGGNSGFVIVQSGVSATGSTGTLVLRTGSPSVGNSGTATLRTGDSTNTGAVSGLLQMFSGDADATSGDVSIRTGAATTRGSITFQDGTEGTAGFIWTSKDTTGKGSWAASTGLTNPTNATVLTGTNNSYDLGATGDLWANIWSTTTRAATVRGVNNGSLSLVTSTTTASSNIAVTTGNGSAGNSGNITVTTGTATATRGSISLSAAIVNSDTDIAVTTIGKGLKVAEGSNGRMGTAVLVAGTVTVSNTSVTANTRIFLTTQAAGGVQGFLSSTRSAGTSFTINSSLSTDTSTIAWLLIEPA